MLSGPRETTINGYAAAEFLVSGSFDGVRTKALMVAIESPAHFHLLVAGCAPSRWAKKAPSLRKIVRSFRLRGDPDPVPSATPVSTPAKPLPKPDSIEGNPQVSMDQVFAVAYIQFLERLRKSQSVNERQAMLTEWAARKLGATEGGSRDLALAVSDGPSSRALDELVIAELTAYPLGIDEVVECLPRVSVRVRRALIARLAAAPPGDQQVFIETLTDSPSQSAPGILEAFLVLGEITSERVSTLVRVQGSTWAEDELQWNNLLAHAEQEPGFLKQLFADPNEGVRVFACKLAAGAQGEGDAQLSLVLPLLREHMGDVRLAAVEALIVLAKPRASWGLARALDREGDPYTRGRLRIALAASERTATLKLLTQLQRRAPADQRAAAIALSAFPAAEALPLLERSFAAEDAAVIRAALETLVELAEREGGSALQSCAKRVAELDVTDDLADLKAKALALLQ